MAAFACQSATCLLGPEANFWIRLLMVITVLAHFCGISVFSNLFPNRHILAVMERKFIPHEQHVRNQLVDIRMPKS